MADQKSKDNLSLSSKTYSPQPLSREKPDVRSHDGKSYYDTSNNQPPTTNTQGSFSGTASHVAEKVKDAFVEGAIAVKEVVTGVGSKITEKAGEYVSHANTTFKKKAALRRAKKAHQRHEEADILEKEAIAMYDAALKDELNELKKRLEVILKELQGLEDRIRGDEAFLLNEKHEAEKKEDRALPSKNEDRNNKTIN
jgi:hypothetical protein